MAKSKNKQRVKPAAGDTGSGEAGEASVDRSHSSSPAETDNEPTPGSVTDADTQLEALRVSLASGLAQSSAGLLRGMGVDLGAAPKKKSGPRRRAPALPARPRTHSSKPTTWT
jgi:hypothetical protein